MERMYIEFGTNRYIILGQCIIITDVDETPSRPYMHLSLLATALIFSGRLHTPTPFVSSGGYVTVYPAPRMKIWMIDDLHE